MKHPVWFVFTFVAVQLWAIHGLYHLAQELRWTWLARTLDPLFGPSMLGIPLHIIVETFDGVALVAFLIFLVTR